MEYSNLYSIREVDMSGQQIPFSQLLGPAPRGRKKKPRQINFVPTLTIWEPTDGIKDTTNVHLGHDELEALRLKHINGLGIISAANQMGISKSLFATIHNAAIKKVTNALIHGRSLHIELGRPEYQEPLSIGFKSLN